MGQIFCFRWASKNLKVFSVGAFAPLLLDQELCPSTTLPHTPFIWLAMCAHLTFFDLATNLDGTDRVSGVRSRRRLMAA